MLSRPTLNNTQIQKTDEAWLCIRLSYLALNLSGIRSNSTNHPVVITSKDEVWQVNKASLKLGIVATTSVNQALSSTLSTKEIIRIERDTTLEGQRLIELAYWAHRFSSKVSIFNENTVLLEIGKSLKLFNGLQNLVQGCKNDLESFGLDCSLGVAHTPLASFILSHSRSKDLSITHCPRRLDNALLSTIPINPNVLTKLENCGFTFLKDVKDVPLSELGSRFGLAFTQSLEKVYGLVSDPQIPISLPEYFTESTDFAEPISNISWIEEQLKIMLEKLIQFTEIRQLAYRSITWSLFREDLTAVDQVTIDLNAAVRATSSQQSQINSLFELTQMKLSSLNLKLEFNRIELACDDLIPSALISRDLFDESEDKASFLALKEKLGARLGHNAMYQLNLKPKILPEHSQTQSQFNQVHSINKQTSEIENTTNLVHNEPMWLFEAPKRLSVSDGKPTHHGSLVFVHGPQRLVSEWWETLQSRDYYIVRKGDGQLLWVFYDRVTKQWFLHGLYA